MEQPKRKQFRNSKWSSDENEEDSPTIIASSLPVFPEKIIQSSYDLKEASLPSDTIILDSSEIAGSYIFSPVEEYSPISVPSNANVTAETHSSISLFQSVKGAKSIY